MTTCRLSLVGSLSENQNACAVPNLPKVMEIHDEPDAVVTIGRENSKSQVSYVLGDSCKPRVVSRLHATLSYGGEDGAFTLTDHSVNGTYVNYVRVPTSGVRLETEDVVCFFHRNGANIKPGEKVEPFDTHLKYRVEFIEDDEEDLDEKNDEKEDNKDDDKDEVENGGCQEHRETKTRGGRTTTMMATTKGVGNKRGSEDDGQQSPVPKRARSKGIINNMNSKSKNTTTILGGTKGGAGSRIRVPRGGTKVPLVAAKATEEEEEMCAADLCLRPIGLAIDWIQCDSCSSWYHQMCLGITGTKIIIDPSKPYFCPNCRGK